MSVLFGRYSLLKVRNKFYVRGCGQTQHIWYDLQRSNNG